MDLNVGALIVTACSAACLGLIALLRAPGRPTNRLFGMHALTVTAWVLVNYQIALTRDAETLGLLLRLAHYASLLAVVTLFDFINVFPDRLRPDSFKRRATRYGIAFAFGLVALHPDLVRSVQRTATGLEVVFGWPLAVLAIYMIYMVVRVNLLLLHKWRVSYGVARVQTGYVLVGTFISELIIITTNIILPMTTGNTEYCRWGVVGYQVTIAAIAIAIARYRLWELGGIGRKLIATVLAAGSLTLGAALLTWLLWPWLGLDRPGAKPAFALAGLLGILFGLLMPPISKIFSDLVSRSAAQEQERIGRLLAALGMAVVHAPSGKRALLPILEETQRFLRASFVEAHVQGGDGQYHQAGLVRPNGEERLPPSESREIPRWVLEAFDIENLSEPLEASMLMRFGSISRSANILDAMDAVGASVVVPLRWHGETTGLLLMGPKVSREMYYPLEIDVLESVAAHAAIALRNAQLRAQIVAEKERTEKVLAEMQSGVVAVGPSGTICLVNAAACRLLGKESHELLEQDINVLPLVLRALLQRAMDSQALVSGERVYLDYRNGLRVSCSTFLLTGEAGESEGAGLVFRDLRTEDALRRSEREKERLQFIRAVSAGMAHEIRNPLVAIRTFAELAPSRLDDPEFRESFIQVAYSEITRLEDLVSHFMTLAKPARDVAEPIDLQKLAVSVTTAISARAEADNIEIMVDAVHSPIMPVGDEMRLRQAIMNLLWNALDATGPGGKIALRTALGKDDDATNCVTLSVWNSGSYIPPDQLERVFEPFYTSKAMGTGLGLAICQTIVDEHGGTMRIESERDTGTTFIINLPLVAPRQMATMSAL